MRYKIFYRLFIGFILLLTLAVVALPVFAIAPPMSISFGTTGDKYGVFYNVAETGDMLFMVEGYVHYAVTPTDYTAKQAFLFEVLDVAGTTVLISTPLQEYEDRPISIYLTATQVTALGLTTGTTYKIRITGNPLVFASPTGNTVTIVLGHANYIDQSLGMDSGVAMEDSFNPLRIFAILMAKTINGHDAPTTAYYQTVNGTDYLTAGGINIFLRGVPLLTTYCPTLGYISVIVVEGDTPQSYGAYSSGMNPSGKWGTTIGNAFTNLGLYMGMSQMLAGGLVFFLLVILLAIYVYQQVQSGVSVVLIVASSPFIGSYLGLIPLALAFVFAIIISILMGYFFFSRGAF